MAKTYYVISSAQYQYLTDSKGPQVEESQEDFSTYLPERLKAKGRTLLQLLENKTGLKIKPDGSLVHKGKHIDGSHIVDLLNLALQSGFKKRCNVRGLREFIDLIIEANVPRYLLSSSFIELANKCL